MLANIDNSSTMNDSAASGEASVSSSGNQMAPSKPEKKKRNLPGMPDPDADIIALSPKSLMAVNRFICEICNKGFKRDQNLQLHRRGHNLPWKLRQRLNKEVRKRVYVCPEESCVHHDPLRALGDLTGIKKHFFRKHGEKKWKCDKCLKKYAVQSDWKAHLKICGTREYKCDCGTLFTRRDSFITHRAFCDALAVESAKEQPFATSSTKEDMETCIVSSSPPSPPSLPTSSAQISALPAQCPELHEASTSNPAEVSSRMVGPSSGSCCSSSSSVFASLFASSTTKFTDLVRAFAQPEPAQPSATAVSLCLATNYESSTFDITRQEYKQYAPLPPPTSATALLQKAAQMGASATNTSALQGFGIVSSTSPSGQQKWNRRNDDSDSASMAAGLGLGLHYDGVSSLKELMMGSSSVFRDEHTTLDFLGLGMAAGGGPARGLSALMTSSCDVTVATTSSSGTDYSGEKMGRSS